MEQNYIDLEEMLSRLQWLSGKAKMLNRMHKGAIVDPSRGQGRVLAMLKIQEEISTKDLSYLLGIRQQSLNELLNKLEKSDYINRIQAESDRRVILVKLTEKGKSLDQIEANETNIFDCLNAEEQEIFGGYLDRLIKTLENQVGVDDDEEMTEWMEDMQTRMGRERFEQLMSMRRSHHHNLCGHGSRGHHDSRSSHGHGRQHDRHETHGTHSRHGHHGSHGCHGHHDSDRSQESQECSCECGDPRRKKNRAHDHR